MKAHPQIKGATNTQGKPISHWELAGAGSTHLGLAVSVRLLGENQRCGITGTGVPSPGPHWLPPSDSCNRGCLRLLRSASAPTQRQQLSHCGLCKAPATSLSHRANRTGHSEGSTMYQLWSLGNLQWYVLYSIFSFSVGFCTALLETLAAHTISISPNIL